MQCAAGIIGREVRGVLVVCARPPSPQPAPLAVADESLWCGVLAGPFQCPQSQVRCPSLLSVSANSWNVVWID